MRRSRSVAMAVLAAGALGGVVAAMPAAARTSRPAIKNGYYANLAFVRSNSVSFHVRGHVRVPDLGLDCAPVDPAYSSGVSTTIDVVAPRLRIRGGRVVYRGAARISGYAPGSNTPSTLGTTTLAITARHVNGPVRHYVFEGRHLSEMTAWRGTVASPACGTLPLRGRITLFGPVAGE